MHRFSLIRFRSPLLTESRLFSLPVGTEMFHFPTFPPHTLCVQARVTGHDSCRVSPFGNPRITARLTAPRGLSQPPTSFIGSWCQGIHRVPLKTWPQRCSRPLCSSQTTTRHRHTRHRPAHPQATGGTRSRPALHETNRPTTGAGRGPFPQDPTACLDRPAPTTARSTPTRKRQAVLASHEHDAGQLVSVPPMSNHPGTRVRDSGSGPGPPHEQARPDAP